MVRISGRISGHMSFLGGYALPPPPETTKTGGTHPIGMFSYLSSDWSYDVVPPNVNDPVKAMIKGQ